MPVNSGHPSPLRVSFDKYIPWEFSATLANAIVARNYLDGAMEKVVAEICIMLK